MKNYLNEFNAMVEEIKNHQELVLLNTHVCPPVTQAEIDEVQEELGFQLEPSILDFYKQANGLSLRWIHKENPNYEPEEYTYSDKFMSHFDVIDNNGEEDGCICILPLKKMLVGINWKDHLYFDDDDEDKKEFMGKSYDSLEFDRSLRPFDYFNFYNMAAFFIKEKTAPLPVIMGDDHGACFDDSLITSFQSYMNFVLAHYGATAPRKETLGQYGGWEQPLFTYDASNPPSLSEVLELVEEEW